MSLSQWQDNISLLETIVNEIIQEENLPNNTHTDIFSQFNAMKNYYTDRRLDYNDYDEINREFLSNMNNYIQQVKTSTAKQEVTNIVTQIGNNHMSLTPAGQDQGQMNYTKDQLMNARMSQFEEQLKSVTDDFNQHQTKRPSEIDFSDKADEPMRNVDSLMELEMKKREYDLKSINEEDMKKAEAWFSNPNKVQIETLPINEPNKIKIEITDKPSSTSDQGKAKLQSILKKVSFQEDEPYSNEPKNVKVDSLLRRLQSDRDKLLPYDTPNVKPTDMTTFTNKTAVSEHMIPPGKPIISTTPSLPIQTPIITDSYNYNTLIINKHYNVSKQLPFLKSPINVSLNNLKEIVVELSKNENVVHTSRAFQYVVQNNYIHYRLIVPYKKENTDLDIKIYDMENNQLIPSLNIEFEKDEIISENVKFLFNGLPFDGIDIDNICVVKLKQYNTSHENVDRLNSLNSKELLSGSEKIDEFTMFSVSNVERNEKEIIIDIQEFNNNYEYLLISKKYMVILNNNDNISVSSKDDIILIE